MMYGSSFIDAQQLKVDQQGNVAMLEGHWLLGHSMEPTNVLV